MSFLDLLLPDHCVLCRMPVRHPAAHRLCEYCFADLPWIACACIGCGLPMASNGLCGQCQHRHLYPGQTIAPLEYRDEGQFLVQRLKFSHGYREGRTLASCIVTRVQQRALPLPRVLIPTPMSWRGFVRRGHNPAQDLAVHIGRQLRIPIIQALAKRHTSPQRSKARHERLQIPPDTFYARRQLPHAHVAIIDDVITTGATIDAMARILTDMGATRVDRWAATRATERPRI